MKPLLAAWMLCALTLFACGSRSEVPLTEVVVVVDTDLAVPDRIDEIWMSIKGPTGAARTATARLGAGEPPLPRSVGLVHDSGPLAPVEVVVQGRLKGKMVLERKANLAFQKGRTLALPMHLVAACVAVACKSTETCTERACQDIDIDPQSLGQWSGMKPGLEGSLDVMDGDVPDADSGSTDPDATVPDATVPDATVPDGSTCVPKTEVCNGLDDNCNERVDEDFNLMSDTNNCGQCGLICTAPNSSCCGGLCINPMNDTNHCGGCGQNCTAPNSSCCGGFCVDLMSDPKHCNACGTACPINGKKWCCAGSCKAGC